MKISSDSVQHFASIVKRPRSYLPETLKQSTPYLSLTEALSSPDPEARKKGISVTGLQGSLSSILVSRLFTDLKVPILLICTPESFELYENDLEAFHPEHSVFNADDELSPALGMLAGKKPVIIISGFEDVATPLCSSIDAAGKIFPVNTGSDAGYDRLMKFLGANSFRRCEFVEDEGEFSVRGAIVDVYSHGSREPVRIEFFGDTVTSIRTFNIDNQLSVSTLESCELTGNFVAESNEPSDAKTILDYLPASALVIVTT